MEKLQKIVRFLDSYLEIDGIKDACWNGLQFEGVQDVEKVLCAVDSGTQTFEYAVKEHADMIVVHHGLFWKFQNPSLAGWFKKQIDILYNNNISLYASHLPLDRHRIVGNNVQLLTSIGASVQNEFSFHNGKNVSFTGMFEKGMQLQCIVDTLNQKLQTNCTVLPFGKSLITSVGVVSGGGGYDDFCEAVRWGLDLYITGESKEIYHMARDAGINVIFGGHHATETTGIKALAEKIQQQFNVTTLFVDIPTGL